VSGAEQMRYMLDTNICIYLMRRRPPAVVERFQRLTRGDVVMFAITLAELRLGIERSPDMKATAKHALGLLLSYILAVSFDADAAVSYGVLAAAVRDRRRDALDRLIATHAVSLSVTLVTNNEADFKDYPGLVIENRVNQSD
jgi:tRNA(fMet)-specific endonuclease VapC